MIRALASVGTTKVIGLLVTFASTVLMLRIISSEYGAEAYGAVSLVATLVTIMPVADLGLSLALTNLATRHHAGTSRGALVLTLSSTTWILSLVGIAVLCGGVVLSVAGAWPTILGPASLLLGDPNAYMIPYSAICAFWVVLSPCYRLLAGLHRVNTVTMLQAAGSAIALICTALAATLHAPLLVFAFFPLIGAVFAMAAGWVVVMRWFAVSRSTILPLSIRRLGMKRIRSVLIGGLSGVAFTVGGLLMFSFDRILLSHFGTAVGLATFAAIIPLFSATQATLGSVGSYLWPHYTRARITGELSRRTIAKHTAVFAAIGIGIGLAIWFGSPLYVLLAGITDLEYSPLVAAIAVFAAVQTATLPLTSSLNTSDVLRLQGLALAGAFIGKLVLSAFLIPLLGAAGTMVSTLIAVSVVQLPALVVLGWKYLPNKPSPVWSPE